MSLLTDLINLDLSESTKKIIAEYIWIGGSGMDMRSKARTLPNSVTEPSEIPRWNYDGSSTGQAPGEDSEVILYPQAVFKDPFRRGNNILVMCDAYTPQGEPIANNNRHNAAKIFSHPDVVAEEPWNVVSEEIDGKTLLKNNNLLKSRRKRVLKFSIEPKYHGKPAKCVRPKCNPRCIQQPR